MVKLEIAQTKADLHKVASQRWLTPQEISNMIYNFEALGFGESTAPPSLPENGQLYFYDRRVVKSYKADGVNWVVRKGSDRVQETYQSLKIDGVDRLLGMYSRSATHSSFRRRIYRTSDTSDPRADKVLIHYRDYPDGDETQKAAKGSTKGAKKSRPKASAAARISLPGMAGGGVHFPYPGVPSMPGADYYMPMPGDTHGEDDDDDGEEWEEDTENIFGSSYDLDEDTRRELLTLMDVPPAQAASPFTAAAQSVSAVPGKPSTTTPGWASVFKPSAGGTSRQLPPRPHAPAAAAAAAAAASRA